MPIPYAARSWPATATPHGTNTQTVQVQFEEQLQRRGGFDHRQMASRVFEDHRFVHHRELQVRRGIVDGNPRVLGERNHHQCDQRHGE